MPQIFHRSTNTLAKVSIFGAIFFLFGFLGICDFVNRSPYVTRVNVAVEQPVPFSHKHHVDQLGIDCRYCHTSVEESAFAGVPPTATCMNCHDQIWKDAPILEPVREAWRNNESLEWVRVHDMPDYVYFDHSVHVNKGISCASCHGRVDQMPLMWKAETMHMSWCLQCHRNPERFVRPKEEVFNMAWKAPNQKELGSQLVHDYEIESLTSCSVCHR
jgi:hypothetical protein